LWEKPSKSTMTSCMDFHFHGTCLVGVVVYEVTKLAMKQCKFWTEKPLTSPQCTYVKHHAFMWRLMVELHCQWIYTANCASDVWLYDRQCMHRPFFNVYDRSLQCLNCMSRAEGGGVSSKAVERARRSSQPPSTTGTGSILSERCVSYVASKFINSMYIVNVTFPAWFGRNFSHSKMSSEYVSVYPYVLLHSYCK
jgi:hypothetical protein